MKQQPKSQISKEGLSSISSQAREDESFRRPLRMFEKQALKCYHPRLRQKYFLLGSKETAYLSSQQSYNADHNRTIIKILMHRQTCRPSFKHERIRFLAWALTSTCSKDRIRFDHLGKVSSFPYRHSLTQNPNHQKQQQISERRPNKLTCKLVQKRHRSK